MITDTAEYWAAALRPIYAKETSYEAIETRPAATRVYCSWLNRQLYLATATISH